MINSKLKTILLTILSTLLFAGFGFIFYKFHTETMYVIIGILILIFIRHTYITIEYLISNE